MPAMKYSSPWSVLVPRSPWGALAWEWINLSLSFTDKGKEAQVSCQRPLGWSSSQNLALFAASQRPFHSITVLDPGARKRGVNPVAGQNWIKLHKWRNLKILQKNSAAALSTGLVYNHIWEFSVFKLFFFYLILHLHENCFSFHIGKYKYFRIGSFPV